MKRSLPILGILLLTAVVASAQAADRWLHVRVEKGGEKAESVRVNLPLTLAEKVLPAIHVDVLRGGKLKVRHITKHDIDLHAILEAVRELEDGEFLTVESDDETVRVAKEQGYLVAKVRQRNQEGNETQKVDVKVPLAVVEALLSGEEEDELDIAAAVRALNQHGDEALMTVVDKNETVRVWVDSRPTME